MVDNPYKILLSKFRIISKIQIFLNFSDKHYIYFIIIYIFVPVKLKHQIIGTMQLIYKSLISLMQKFYLYRVFPIFVRI